MLTTVEGVYSGGTIKLLETPTSLREGRVLVTFLGNGEKKPARQMVFGQFAGSVLPSEEDFKIAEWHGEEEFEALNGR